MAEEKTPTGGKREWEIQRLVSHGDELRQANSLDNVSVTALSNHSVLIVKINCLLSVYLRNAGGMFMAQQLKCTRAHTDTHKVRVS